MARDRVAGANGTAANAYDGAMRAPHIRFVAPLALALVASACGIAPTARTATQPAPQAACHPAIDASRPQFVVGYGSLMEDDSRRRTSPRAGAAHPIEVTGYERGWFERGSAIGFSTTYLGVRPSADATMNAVVYALQPEELAATDARESSYCRAAIPGASVKALAGPALSADAQLWIYVTDPHRIAAPDAGYPIVQSYVDVFLSGCLEQEERFALHGFARRCVATTTGWSGEWVNDRIFPRRPFIHQPRAGAIDRLLAATLPREFARIHLEPGGSAAPR
jgi:hypothetical protein